jgi:chromosome segregation ATPase
MPDVSQMSTERAPADPLVEPLSQLATELSRIAAEIQAVECSHLERMETASAELRKQVEVEVQAQVASVYAGFEERLRSAAAEWDAERQSLQKQIEQSRRTHSNDHGREEEVARTEAALAQIDREIQAMLDDPNGDLSQIMRKNALKSELQAYFKGLTF